MSLKYALLGFVSYKAMSGYELKQHFDNSVKHFWHANLSQIYPTLRQMEKEGLLVMEVEFQENRPNRKVYRITDAGREELKRWLGERQQLYPVRDPFLVQVFFGARLEKEKSLAILKDRLQLYRGQLESYLQLKEHFRQMAPQGSTQKDAVFWEMTLDAGIRHGKAAVEWLEESIGKVASEVPDKTT
jgi:DNA-binding PadR family transcriptional regulator